MVKVEVSSCSNFESEWKNWTIKILDNLIWKSLIHLTVNLTSQLQMHKILSAGYESLEWVWAEMKLSVQYVLNMELLLTNFWNTMWNCLNFLSKILSLNLFAVSLIFYLLKKWIPINSCHYITSEYILKKGKI